MPARFKEKLRQFIDQSTGLVGIVGFGSLTCFSLALPDLPDLTPATLSDFLRRFDTVADALRYLEPKIAPLLLIGVTIFWYYQYKNTVIKELGLIDNVFQEDHAPVRPEGLDWYRLIPFIGYLLVGTYCALILLAPYISLYCMGALVLHGTDMTGSAIAIQSLNKTLAEFPIVGKTPRANFAKRRRKALREYYFDNPTIPRIVVIFIVTAGTLLISLQIAPNLPIFYLVSYALMITNILVGEFVIWVWRSRRDRQLDEILVDEDKYNARKRKR